MATVIIVGGPAGTGKTTIASLLAEHHKCPFIEGDNLHPKENVDKMARGEPLTDDDRWGWLQTLAETAASLAKDPKNASQVAIASCSMLKKVYRDFLEKSAGDGVTFRFVFLHTHYDELLKRVSNRQGHYMKSDMVKSQYDIMEVPSGDELLVNGGEALEVDTTDKEPENILKEILTTLDK
ncbi:CIC11C00000005012 [Sungouiella intermedia]|uniref:Gluconokinase n=1 Tax=Sungouiella intermedia TaxID=45354 RepID=A0A1L0C245_9ASCO|nr:CIC11C00000005012 [[Candida] intermedia]